LAVVLVSSLLFAAVTAPVEAQIPVTPILPPTPTPASLRQGLTPLVFPLPSPTPQLSLLSIQDATIREPVRGTSNLLFTVVLTPVAAQDVRVSFITRGVGSAQGPLPGPLPSSACGTADGADYRFTSGALTIPAGQSSRTIPITICSDGRVEGPETSPSTSSTW